MSEGVKTLIFAAAALVVAAAAVMSRPRPVEMDVQSEVGKMMFPKFDDPAKAASIEITAYDESGKPVVFRVARDAASGAWVIPSLDDYPADAEDRLRDAALLVIDLKILGVPTEVPEEHAMFGVLSPESSGVQDPQDVGMMVKFEDDKGQELASLIIGHKRRDAEEQRYVRKPDKDVVYVARIDPDQLSTKFEDWIEKDLLQLSSFDIEDLTINRYKTDVQLDMTTGGLKVREDKFYDLSTTWKDNEWQLNSFTRYQNNQKVASTLGNDEELNKDKLNDLKTAVDDLEIVDVRRKPKGLGADLKGDKGLLEDRQGMQDLLSRGFYLLQTAGDKQELLSANGDTHVVMKDGVEYLLRFGEVAKARNAQEEGGENRYLFVTTRVSEDKIPEPEYEPLPERPEGEPAAEGEDAPDADEDAEQEAGEPAEGESAADASEDGAEGEEAGSEEAGSEEAETDQEAAESEYERERDRVVKENERKRDEYEEKLKKAKEKVAELNTRFADWYYVVSNEEYEKIQLSLEDVIKPKEQAEEEADADGIEGDDIDDFRKLQEEGLGS